jgi:hypothetical protein
MGNYSREHYSRGILIEEIRYSCLCVYYFKFDSLSAHFFGPVFLFGTIELNVYVLIKRQHLTYFLPLGYSALWPSLNSNTPKGLLWIHSIHQCLPASLELTTKLPMIKMYWNAMGSYVAPQKRLCPLLLNFTKLLLIPSKPRA